MPAACVPLLDAISFETGAAMMPARSQRSTCCSKPALSKACSRATTWLFHAAAGGGLIARQWHGALACSSLPPQAAKKNANPRSGQRRRPRHQLPHGRLFVARVREITGGQGESVYDRRGQDTWDKSLDRLRPFGPMASFGNASGPVPAFSPALLGPRPRFTLRAKPLFTTLASAHPGHGRCAVRRGCQRPGEDPHRPELPRSRCSKPTATWKPARPPVRPFDLVDSR